jgi:hypothetical protein
MAPREKQGRPSPPPAFSFNGSATRSRRSRLCPNSPNHPITFHSIPFSAFRSIGVGIVGTHRTDRTHLRVGIIWNRPDRGGHSCWRIVGSFKRDDGLIFWPTANLPPFGCDPHATTPLAAPTQMQCSMPAERAHHSVDAATMHTGFFRWSFGFIDATSHSSPPHDCVHRVFGVSGQDRTG